MHCQSSEPAATDVADITLNGKISSLARVGSFAIAKHEESGCHFYCKTSKQVAVTSYSIIACLNWMSNNHPAQCWQPAKSHVVSWRKKTGIVNIAALFCDQTIWVFCSWTFDSAANGPPSWPFHIINLTNCSFIPSDMIFSLEENMFFWLPICCFDVDKLPPKGWNPCASVNVWANPVTTTYDVH